MDWNWFFSSLSQSAAAIVGVFGAFIISKILSNQTIFQQKNNRLNELITEGRKFSEEMRLINIQWYNRRMRLAALAKFEELLRDFNFNSYNGDFDFILEHKRCGFSIFSPRPKDLVEMKKIFKKYHDEYLQRVEMHRQYEERNKNLESKDWSLNNVLNRMGAYHERVYEKSVINDPNWNVKDQISEITKSISTGWRDVKHHVRVVSDFIDTIEGNPESSPQIAYSLILITALFYVGVIGPLFFCLKLRLLILK